MDFASFVLWDQRILLSSRKTVKVSMCEYPQWIFKCSKRSVRMKTARSKMAEDAVPCVQTWMYAFVSCCFTVEIIVDTVVVLVEVVTVLIT
jgi:hypothetical protein